MVWVCLFPFSSPSMEQDCFIETNLRKVGLFGDVVLGCIDFVRPEITSFAVKYSTLIGVLYLEFQKI